MSTAEKELENCPTLEEIDEKLEETEKEFQETREEVEKLHVKDDCHHDQAESCAKSKLNIGASGAQYKASTGERKQEHDFFTTMLCFIMHDKVRVHHRAHVDSH